FQAIISDNAKELILTIQNVGPSLSAEKFEQIFQRFYRESSHHNEAVSGNGIGLAYTRELVEMLGGRIVLGSPPAGGGCCFEVHLPFIQQAVSTRSIKDHFHPDNLPLHQSLTPPPQPASDKRRQLLIVEDNDEMRQLLITLLQDHFQIIAAENGQSGLAIARAKLPDLIISDLMMPLMDGLRLAGALKNDMATSHIPIILLTAKDSQQTALDSYQAEVSDYLTKPFHPSILLAKVKSFLAHTARMQCRFARENGAMRPKMANQLDQQFMDRMISFVLRNLDDPDISANALAREMGLSKAQLYRKLKALTGQSINIFIRNIRLDEAYQLLRDGFSSVKEIAYIVGFHDPNYFSRLFRQRFGHSPRDMMAKQLSPGK
ncbi:MAG: response regulator, partial [Bacteroidota bacterium]